MSFWWQTLIGAGVALALAWLALVAALLVARPKGALLSEATRLLPDLLRLLRRLAADRDLPRGVRIRLALLLFYLAIPIGHRWCPRPEPARPGETATQLDRADDRARAWSSDAGPRLARRRNDHHDRAA